MRDEKEDKGRIQESTIGVADITTLGTNGQGSTLRVAIYITVL